MKTAAIYARVSSDQQKEEKTIASQTAALREFARQEGYQVPDEWVFEDEGYSGASLIRPGLERIRDLAAEGQIQAVLALSPDRLSRKYAYQDCRATSPETGLHLCPPVDDCAGAIPPGEHRAPVCGQSLQDRTCNGGWPHRWG